jgi:hypothetical protein
VVLSFVLSKIQALSPYLSTPKSRTRRRISIAGLNVREARRSSPWPQSGPRRRMGGWPAKPAGWSYWTPNAATFAAMSAGET